MNKPAVGIIIAIVVLALIGGAVYSNNSRSGSDDSSDDMSSMSSASKSTTKPQDSMDSNEVKSGMVSMNIQDFDFQNQKLKIKVGTMVTWTNKDDAKHDVAPDNDGPDFIGSEKLLAKGESYSYTFAKAGTFAYHCTPHPYMKAMIEVVE